MPNWCNTSYAFEGNTKEIADLYQKLESLERNPGAKAVLDFGKDYMGNVITIFGGNDNDFDCQGTLDSVELLNDTTLYVSTATGWREPNKIWDFVLKDYPSVRYYYYADEPGCRYYVTNDTEGKYFPDRFVVEQGDAETTYHGTKEGLLKDISERIGIELNSKSHMKRELSVWNKLHSDDDDWINVNEIEVVE